MIKVIIDDKEVLVEKGSTILDAAKSANIYIPTLCYGEKIAPFGACRLCIVEIKGVKNPSTACTTPAEDGMIVYTNTPKIQELRRNILELILSEHPYTCLICKEKEDCFKYEYCIKKLPVTTGCLFCPSNNKCELQKVVEYIGIKEVKITPSYKELSVEKIDPFFDRDYNLCILCGKCVRTCKEVRGIGAISFINRGSKTIIGTAFNKPLHQTECEFCGACIDVCPTGAISERINRWEGLPDKVIKTTCPFCSICCKIELQIKENRVIGVKPVDGNLCMRGRFTIPYLIHHPDRLKKPLIRKNGKLLENTWDEAIEFIVEKIKKYKKDEIAINFSYQCTNEDIYIIKKFANMLGIKESKKIKFLYLIGDAPAYNIKDIEFLVVQNVFYNEVSEKADVVLPVASFAEIDGTFTNNEGVICYLNKAIEPIGESKADWMIICEIAKKLGIKGFDYNSAEEIRKDIKEYEIKEYNLDYYRGGYLIDKIKGLNLLRKELLKKCIK